MASEELEDALRNGSLVMGTIKVCVLRRKGVILSASVPLVGAVMDLLFHSLIAGKAEAS